MQTPSSARRENLHRIQKYLSEQQLDGWLLYDFRGTNPVALHLANLTSSGTRRWFLWIPAEGDPLWLVHAIEANTFSNLETDLAGEIRYYLGWRQLNELLPALINASADHRLRIAMEYSPLAAIPYVSTLDAGTKELIEQATGAQIVSSADLVQLVQAVLSPEQLAGHRVAAESCMAVKDAAFDLVRQALQDGKSITEFDVQQFILEQFEAAGLVTDHGPIVAVNAQAADPHYAPSAQRHNVICRGDMLLIDLWARRRGGSNECYADLTWTAYCGEETPDAVRAIYEIVAGARDRAVAFIQEKLDRGEMVHGYEVDDACRAVIDAAGYGDHFIHRTGHSLGSTLHFNGVNIDNLEIQDRRQLIPGVMFTVEPGIYLPTFNFDGGPVAKGLGIRSEVNCVMHDGRVEVTTLPLQTQVQPLLK